MGFCHCSFIRFVEFAVRILLNVKKEHPFNHLSFPDASIFVAVRHPSIKRKQNSTEQISVYNQFTEKPRQSFINEARD